MKKICTFAGLLCVSVSMYAQSVKISGTVTDEMGPVVGASVMVKGTKTGTVTDMNGRYTISADKNAVLVFSYVGANPVEKTVTGGVLDVSLTSNVQSINEVATRTGFANVNYFSTAFKELYGLTPTAYMEQCLKASDDRKQ